MSLNITGYYTLRRDLMSLANEFNAKRLELVVLQEKISEGISLLVNASERVFTKSLDELGTDGELKKEFGGPLKDAIPDEEAVQRVADHVNPNRRSCGLCGKPGHRRTNCPDADKVLAEKKATSNTKVERAERKAALKGTGKRACSNCRKPGHRAKNCPEPVLKKKRKKREDTFYHD